MGRATSGNAVLVLKVPLDHDKFKSNFHIKVTMTSGLECTDSGDFVIENTKLL